MTPRRLAMSESLHLVKIPVRPAKLVAVGRRRKLTASQVDEGYLMHCLLRELWQQQAPMPFVLRGRGRVLDVWGYSRVDAATLVDHARAFGDPSLLAAIADLDAIDSKVMPCFAAERRLGFLLRACPVVRLARATHEHRAGAEVDAFLARCFAASEDGPESRESVYTEWLTEKVDHPEITGVKLDRVRVASMARERLLRRTHGTPRTASALERPVVRFEGDLVVQDGQRFQAWLAHGVGRHRAFGFGAVMLVPPGTTHAV